MKSTINKVNSEELRTIKCTFIGSLINKFDTILSNDEAIDFYKNNNLIYSISYEEIESFAKYKKGIIFSSIIIKTNKIKKFIFLKKNNINKFIDILNNKLSYFLTRKIQNKCNEFYNRTSINFPRDSWFEVIKSLVDDIQLFCNNNEQYNIYFDDKTKSLIKNIIDIKGINIKELQSIYEKNQLESRKDFFDNVENYPLTNEQRLGVIRTNDRNMVLAAAGTGKTSVIVAKVLDIIQRNICDTNEILVLAYNRLAAKELLDRIESKAKKSNIQLDKKPYISTFHALGRYILKESGIRPTISIFAEDELKFNNWVTEWFINYLKKDISNFLELLVLFPEPFDPFTTSSKAEYERYIRDNDFRTLSNEKVKGYQELLIANYLFLNGINYKYEEPYLKKIRLENNIDYRPDFHICNSNIYIEHYGIDKNGNTRKDVDSKKYNELITKKRELHKKYGTYLIETYHYEWIDEKLLDNLKLKLEKAGIKLRPRTNKEIEKYIEENKMKISEWAKVFIKSLNAIRVENLNRETILERLKKAGIDKPERKCNLLVNLCESYKHKLEEDHSIDFDDMILRASNIIEEKKYIPEWKYILVDEYQDISTSRMNLVTSLIKHGPNPSLTVVGDDWQAIYRFSGGKLELTTKFEEMIGKCSMTMLQKTFRYNNSIADISEKFIMENPEQIKKHIETHQNVDRPQVFLLDDTVNDKKNLELKILHTIKKIKENDNKCSIAIIARYNYILNNINKQVSNFYNENIKYWTFHRSKGLEADYAILVGLTQGKLGFPTENKDDAIVEALLPLADDFPHSEERRLMYVGMTRAKKQCYIIGDPQAPSAFVTEMLSAWYNIDIQSKYFTKSYMNLYKCPNCVDGYLRLFNGKYGQIYLCSSGKACSVGKARVCEKCGSPSVDFITESKCMNPKCGYSFPICERCGRPMKLRNGPYGKFYGCSGYGIKDDQCKNTRKLEFVNNS